MSQNDTLNGGVEYPEKRIRITPEDFERMLEDGEATTFTLFNTGIVLTVTAEERAVETGTDRPDIVPVERDEVPDDDGFRFTLEGCLRDTDEEST